MISLKCGVLRFCICFYFVVSVLQLNAVLILFPFTKCESSNEYFPSPFKNYSSPFFLFPSPFKEKDIEHLWDCCNTVIICNKRTGNRNTFFTFMVLKPKNIMISILFMLLNIILFML